MVDALEQAGLRLQHRHGAEPIPVGEIVREVVAACGCAPGSVLPADHCYDRINDSVGVVDVPLFVHAGADNSGRYWFVGRDHAYTGPRYHCPKGGPPRQVGESVHGDYRPAEETNP